MSILGMLRNGQEIVLSTTDSHSAGENANHRRNAGHAPGLWRRRRGSAAGRLRPRPGPSLRGGCRRRSAGPLSGRRCALAGYVAASIMEWPGLACDDAILKTLRTITDFYRVKLSGGTARSTRQNPNDRTSDHHVRGRQDAPRQDRSLSSRPSTTALRSLANQSAIGRKLAHNAAPGDQQLPCPWLERPGDLLVLSRAHCKSVAEMPARQAWPGPTLQAMIHFQ
jgi:hypothetical protein